MRYALHLTDKIYPDYITLGYQPALMLTNNFSLLETIAESIYNSGHKKNFLVVYENGKIHTILKSPKQITFN